MKAPFSPYLAGMAPGLKQLISLLREKYDYVSVLATDSTGFQTSISQKAKSVSRETLTTERGTVIRVYRPLLTRPASSSPLSNRWFLKFKARFRAGDGLFCFLIYNCLCLYNLYSSYTQPKMGG